MKKIIIAIIALSLIVPALVNAQPLYEADEVLQFIDLDVGESLRPRLRVGSHGIAGRTRAVVTGKSDEERIVIAEQAKYIHRRNQEGTV